MASNSMGQVFRITTWGESHGPAMGVVIDGCPAGLALDVASVQAALDRRAPGRNPQTSPRREPDALEVLSGLYQGVTTGAPLSLMVRNCDADSRPYQAVSHVLKPGHAQATYLAKYGHMDDRGGGRASARETVCRVAAGAVASQLLAAWGIALQGVLVGVGHVVLPRMVWQRSVAELKGALQGRVLGCPDASVERAMGQALDAVREEGDSLGGCVGLVVDGLPPGLGDPVYEKLEANLAKAMLSLPASKAVAMGLGFEAARCKGSEHNDGYRPDGGSLGLASNQAGGTLGGISTGMPVYLEVAFKPTSSIRKPQPSLDLKGEVTTFSLPSGSRHDPCVAIRAVPVVEAMAALVLVDAVLMQRLARV